MEAHRLHEELLKREVRVLVAGCGGTGSGIIGGLPYLHCAMLAQGHPHGLSVTVMDGDNVSAANSVRQPFSRAEIGLNKAIVLVNRINLFWGLNWQAIPHALTVQTLAPSYAGYGEPHLRPDIMVGCVDTRAARAVIAKSVAGSSTTGYWLDHGNHATGGQFVLGEPQNARNKRSRLRLRTAGEMYEELVNPDLENDHEPSCSAIESLDRQEPFATWRWRSTVWRFWHVCSATVKSRIMAVSLTWRAHGAHRCRLTRCSGAGSENGQPVR